jgi:hypothetical protein
MPAPQIKSIEFTSPPKAEQAEILVYLQDGSKSRISLSTPQRPAVELKKSGFAFGSPRLFVQALDEESIGEAVSVMAGDIGGFWLRYYSRDRGGEGAPQKASLVELTEQKGGSASTQVRLEDGRQFTILTATPAWFEENLKKLKLRYYFGPAVLFVKSVDLPTVKAAVEVMAKQGDQWLCQYDTPRVTLPKVLADFKSKHA